jgi:hypothetical protein
VDDRELETLFAAAPGDPPPATFDKSDVVAASKRAQARRRSAIAVTCSCLVVLLAGLGAFVAIAKLASTPVSGGFAAADAPIYAQSGVNGQPGGIPIRPPTTGDNQGFPTQSPMQGGDETGKNGPRVESASGCDKVDRELATALAGELPGTEAPGATPGTVCPTGARSAGFPFDGGVVSVALVPPGTTPQLPAQPAGTVRAEAKAVSGGTVLLLSIPPSPLTQADVERIAQALAARF